MFRVILASFLAFVMLTPALVCAMPVCEEELRVASDPPCPGHAPAPAQTDPLQNVTLLKDCMGVELSAADNAPFLKKIDLNKGALVLDGMMGADGLSPALLPDARFSIRGPPPDWAASHSLKPEPLLISQRLRI